MEPSAPNPPNPEQPQSDHPQTADHREADDRSAKRAELSALGYLGLLPFAMGACAALTTPWLLPSTISWAVIDACISYGGIIAAYMAGMGAGALVAQPRGNGAPLLPGMIAALVAWVGLWPGLPFIPAARGVQALLIAGVLIFLYVHDQRAAERGNLPGWYMPLRARLTIGASLAMVIMGVRQIGWYVGLNAFIG